MNNEPVAWMLVTGHGTKILEKKPYCAVDYWIPLYRHPSKELHLSLQKSKQTGELLAVTYTDDEHRIVEVLWQRPSELTDEEILEVWRENERVYPLDRSRLLDRTRACIRKAQEKGNEMTLLEEAKKLADDIREYAPDTNIELMIRDLIKEIERLQSEKTVAIKSKAKVKAS